MSNRRPQSVREAMANVRTPDEKSRVGFAWAQTPVKGQPVWVTKNGMLWDELLFSHFTPAGFVVYSTKHRWRGAMRWSEPNLTLSTSRGVALTNLLVQLIDKKSRLQVQLSAIDDQMQKITTELKGVENETAK